MGGRQQPRAAGALLLLLEVYKLQQGHELLGTSLGKHGAACMHGGELDPRVGG